MIAQWYNSMQKIRLGFALSSRYVIQNYNFDFSQYNLYQIFKLSMQILYKYYSKKGVFKSI